MLTGVGEGRSAAASQRSHCLSLTSSSESRRSPNSHGPNGRCCLSSEKRSERVLLRLQSLKVHGRMRSCGLFYFILWESWTSLENNWLHTFTLERHFLWSPRSHTGFSLFCFDEKRTSKNDRRPTVFNSLLHENNFKCKHLDIVLTPSSISYYGAPKSLIGWCFFILCTQDNNLFAQHGNLFALSQFVSVVSLSFTLSIHSLVVVK